MGVLLGEISTMAGFDVRRFVRSGAETVWGVNQAGDQGEVDIVVGSSELLFLEIAGGGEFFEVAGGGGA